MNIFANGKEVVVEAWKVLRFKNKAGKIIVSWKIVKMEEWEQKEMLMEWAEGTRNVPIFNDPSVLYSHIENMLYQEYDVEVVDPTGDAISGVQGKVYQTIQQEGHRTVLKPNSGKQTVEKEAIRWYIPKEKDIITYDLYFSQGVYPSELTVSFVNEKDVYYKLNGFSYRVTKEEFQKYLLEKCGVKEIQTDYATEKKQIEIPDPEADILLQGGVFPLDNWAFLSSDQLVEYRKIVQIGDTIEWFLGNMYTTPGKKFTMEILEVGSNFIAYHNGVNKVEMNRANFYWELHNSDIVSIQRA